MSRLLRNEKDKAISTLASGQDFLAVHHFLAACFTLRGHDTLIDFLWFLNFWSA